MAMRKISELFARGAGATDIAHQNFDGGGIAAMIDYRIAELPGAGNQMQVIKNFYDLIDFPRSMRDGNLMNFSGVAGEEIVFMSVWDSEANAAAAYRDMGPSIGQATARAGPQVHVERRSSGVYRFAVGDDLAEFAHDRAVPEPDCVGYLIDVPLHGSIAYDLICEKMRFPHDWPEGLLMHVAGSADIGWRTFSIWRDREQSRAFLAERLMPASVDVVRDTGLFPEIRPLEVKPYLFAVNARMLG